MSKSSTTMLRTRRRDNNVKPNRREPRFTRLDRKSSRGMIYENEELRLRTININAEIERGQDDIKKLKRENELLKKEIWSLRDEYEKLDKLLKDKDLDFSSSSSTTCSSDSESCSSCVDEQGEEVETSQNFQNVQKTNLKNLHTDFDHLSIVPEENSTENSDRNSNPNQYSQENDENNVIKPDQSYPLPPPTIGHFFSPVPLQNTLNSFKSNQNHDENNEITQNLAKTTVDLVVQGSSASTFSNGGNLDELLNDIEAISQDILEISNQTETNPNETGTNREKPYKSELSVVLMPNPMPLLGFDKYKQHSIENLPNPPEPPFYFSNLPIIEPNIANFSNAEPKFEHEQSDFISSENDENLKSQAFKPPEIVQKADNDQQKEKLSIRRKVSIHFKGKKEKSESKHKKTPSIESKSETELKTPTSSSSDHRKSVQLPNDDRKSASPEVGRKKHKKHLKVGRSIRRGTVTSIDRLHRERSFSIGSNMYGAGGGYYEDSERTSVSSCDTVKTRKMSSMSNIPLNGKVPWCACWGNGCI